MSNNNSGTEKFPPLSPVGEYDESYARRSSSRGRTANGLYAQTNGTSYTDKWQPKREGSSPWRSGGTGRGRQKSLSEAIRTIRTRQGSMSANAHEIADALKAPVSWKLIILCGIWYMTSILSNTSSKAILMAFPKPITLTIIQFAFVSSWCVVLARLARSYPRMKTAMPALKFGIRPPTKELILATLPLTLFQIGGHILSSDAMARIPVSLVHTIKGLSPLFTVLAYRLFFRIQYSLWTYLSLIPLTLGVVMACSANFSANFLGLLYAFGSAILFVTQNIVSKKLFTEAAQAEAEGQVQKQKKPDKLNLLCYSSGLAFAFTAPIWLWSEGFGLIGDFLKDASIDLSDKPGSLDHGRLTLEFIFNGTFHFGQNLVAFQLLSMVSPVTYSVASLIKRVFVIVFAIVWFGNAMTSIQGLGISLTFLGLYLYDRTKDTKSERKAELAGIKDRGGILPLSNERGSGLPTITDSPRAGSPISGEEKRFDAAGPGVSRDGNGTAWLPPGTKQEETWKARDVGRGPVLSVR